MKIQSDTGTKTTSSILSSDEILTTKELMRLLKIRHRQTVYKLVEQGMPAIAVGRNYRFIRDEVLSFLKQESKKLKVKEYGIGVEKIQKKNHVCG